jgi:hypothetical protein
MFGYSSVHNENKQFDIKTKVKNKCTFRVKSSDFLLSAFPNLFSDQCVLLYNSLQVHLYANIIQVKYMEYKDKFPVKHMRYLF